jgi:glycogen operon protein
MAIRNNIGFSFPLGARVYPDGVNFSLYSEHATGIELLLFDHVDDSRQTDVIRLNLRRNRTGHYWHVYVPNLMPGQLYGYRVDGPYKPWHGMRYDPDKLLLDPYGRGLSQPSSYNRYVASLPGENNRTAMKSVVLDPRTYDWEGDKPLQRPITCTAIYELHVKGFTRHPNSGLPDEIRGTYAGLIAKIPYLQELGITAVELLPVFQYDEQDAPTGLVNYWGYSPVSFFAPHCGYSSRKDPLGPVDEFRDMVKALHRAGIEVILDVVYNHTAEGNHNGPTVCFRG